MYIIGTKLDVSNYINISNTEFMKTLVDKLTKGLIKSTDESGRSHLYVEISNPDNSGLVCTKFF